MAYDSRPSQLYRGCGGLNLTLTYADWVTARSPEYICEAIREETNRIIQKCMKELEIPCESVSTTCSPS